MYCHYYDGKEEFLSIYTERKLLFGGEPVITAQELQKALQAFGNHRLFRNDLAYIAKMKNFRFDNLKSIGRSFQKKASYSRSWLKPCFIYKDEKLYPTYDFYNFVQTDIDIDNFLYDYSGEFKYTKITGNLDECDETIKKHSIFERAHTKKYSIFQQAISIF